MKFVRVNMNDRTVRNEDVPQAYLGLGGRGLTSIFVNTEVPPMCDPLGPDNKLIFAPGSLGGTPLVNTSRISVGSKSPLTGGIKESNAGGTIGAAIGKLGITALIVEGQCPEGDLYVLRVDRDGKAELISGQDYRGMRTYKLAEKLFETFGKENAIVCIGPAGRTKIGCRFHTKHGCRWTTLPGRRPWRIGRSHGFKRA